MTHTISQMKWVRPPQQSRSHKTLERILDAAEQVFAEKGFKKATVAEIVERAKTSVGALYGRFEDKHSLLACVYERFIQEALATADSVLNTDRWDGATIAEIFDEIIPFLVGIYQEKSGLIQAFLVRETSDDEFAKKAGSLFRYVSGQLTGLLLERIEEISHPDPALAVDFGLRMVFDALDQATLFAAVQRSTHALPPDQFAEELKRNYLSYLGVSSPSFDGRG